MEGRLTSRRQFLALMGAATATSLVAACGQAGTPAAAPTSATSGAATPAPATGALNPEAAATGTALSQFGQAVQTKQGADIVQLTYWHSWTGDVEKQVNQVATMFNSSHPNIQVTPQVIPSADFDTKVLTSVSAGNPPDACMLWNSTGRLYTFASQNALTPLQDVVEDLDAFKEFVLPSMWDLGTYKGKMYAVPQWSQAYGLLWNKKMFQEAGLDPEKGPQTTDELVEMAVKLTKKAPDGNIEVLGLNDIWLNRWLPGFGGRLVDDAGDKITANDPSNVRALDWMASIAKAVDPTKFADFRSTVSNPSGGVVLDSFVAGKVAMQADGCWKLQTIQRVAPEDFEFGVTSLPSTGDASKFPYCWTYGDIPVIPANVEHKAESAVYVTYLCGFGGEDAYVEMFRFSNLQVPSTRKIVDSGKFDSIIEQYPGYDTFLNDFFNAKSYLYPAKIPTAAFYDQRLRSAVDSVILGSMSAQQALDNLTTEVQSELDRWNAQN